MDIKNYVKTYSLPFDKVKTDFKEDFDSLYEFEKDWNCNVADKLHRLKNEELETTFKEIIDKLQNEIPFSTEDTPSLSLFISNVNTIVRIANRVNNFTEGAKLNGSKTLSLFHFFNAIRESKSLSTFEYNLNKNLGRFLPHIYSIVKHCHKPAQFPIYYKLSKNIIREVFSIADGYDNLCAFYQKMPLEDRHLNYGTYLGTIALQVVKIPKNTGIDLTFDSKEYKYLAKDLITVQRYQNLLNTNILISNYKKHISETQLKEEIYKWELLEKYKGRPDTKAEDFLTEVKSVKYKNLVYPIAQQVLYLLAKDRPIKLKQLFNALFDESIDITKRVKAFNEDSLTLYKEIEPKLNHYQDERSIATYLTFHNPVKHTFYKSSFYKKYCKILDIKEAKKNEKYAHYRNLIDDLIENYIVPDKDLIEQVKTLIPKYYDGSNHLLLAQDILYQMLDNGVVQTKDQQKPSIQYWLYAPGDNARHWEEFYNNGIMGLGWENIGNYNQYKSIKEIQKSIESFEEDKKSKKRSATAIYNFKENMSHGDIVFARDGRRKLVGYGIVKSDYGYDESRSYYHNYRIVEWQQKGEWELSSMTAIDTLTDITDKASKHPAYTMYYDELLALMNQNELTSKRNNMKYPLNTILYGPPGTGKTYNTINTALSITDPDFLNKNHTDRKALNTRFKELRYNPETGEGQIAFITFHQSMSYEDFIEGIKPLKPLDNEPLGYDVVDGIFKNLCRTAKEKTGTRSFDIAYEEFKNDVIEKEIITLNTPVQKKPFEIKINSAGNCIAKPKTEAATEMTVTKRMIFDYFATGKIRDWKPYLVPIAEYLINNYSFQLDEIDNTQKPYILIIDEINRGNVSQVFGELITLIETDKRNGASEELELILPYSKEKFSVPNNLYIIGTMNTADRSVEALDTALRRRFSFIEMNPKPEILSSSQYKCRGVDLEALLSALNGRIEKLLDGDYCIGHSYFMSIENKKEPLEELKIIFQNKILPLLQEYFYGDWGKIMLVVGEEFIGKKETGITFLSKGIDDDYDEYNEKPIYYFKKQENWSLDSFKSIYAQS